MSIVSSVQVAMYLAISASVVAQLTFAMSITCHSDMMILSKEADGRLRAHDDIIDRSTQAGEPIGLQADGMQALDGGT